MKATPLNRVDVTRRRPNDPGVIRLIENGYRYKVTPEKVFLQRVVKAARFIC